MAKVSLSKALKLKNRQVQKVAELRKRIAACNSVLAGSTPDFDAAVLLRDLESETAKLWKLKAAINEANVPIHGLLYEASELRGYAAWLQTLDTKQGLQATLYMATEPQAYTAQIDAAQVVTLIEATQARLDEIQDLLDAHNANTQIEVEA